MSNTTKSKLSYHVNLSIINWNTFFSVLSNIIIMSLTLWVFMWKKKCQEVPAIRRNQILDQWSFPFLARFGTLRPDFKRNLMLGIQRRGTSIGLSVSSFFGGLMFRAAVYGLVKNGWLLIHRVLYLDPSANSFISSPVAYHKFQDLSSCPCSIFSKFLGPLAQNVLLI